MPVWRFGPSGDDKSAQPLPLHTVQPRSYAGRPRIRCSHGGGGSSASHQKAPVGEGDQLGSNSSWGLPPPAEKEIIKLLR